MKKNHIVKGLLLITALFFTGCASYSPSLVRMDPYGPKVEKQEQEILSIYLEEFATPEKSEKAFDSNLISDGILPLLLQVQNNGQVPYEVKTKDIIVREGENIIKALTPEQAANKAKRNPVFRALGWSMVVPIITIPVAVTASALHTRKVNKQIVHDFSAKAFPDGILLPNKERSGFLFFQLPKGRKDLSDLTLEVKAKNETMEEIITITAPLPSATFKPIKDSSSGEEKQE
jgi:hypothetical protein